MLARRLNFSGARWQQLRSDYTLEGQNINERMNVAFATGCFMMVRTHVIAQQLGGFDPHYFLYHEDSDLSRRVLANGGSILYTPDICVTHAWKRDSAHTLPATLHHLKSTIRYFNKWGWKW